MTAGVYAIVNTANGKAYIGSSIHIALRWAHHRFNFRRGRGPSKAMAKDWQITGGQGFDFVVLEVIAPDNDALERAERHWLNQYQEKTYNRLRPNRRAVRLSDLTMTRAVFRIPQSVAERAKHLAESQERTMQAVYTRALRLGLDAEEEHDIIAHEAIEAAGRRHQPRAAPDVEVGDVTE